MITFSLKTNNKWYPIRSCHATPDEFDWEDLRMKIGNIIYNEYSEELQQAYDEAMIIEILQGKFHK